VARLTDDGPRLRIFVDKDRFVVDITRAASEADFETAMALVRDKLLPLVAAREIESHSGWE
jgi:hypothetical protein